MEGGHGREVSSEIPARRAAAERIGDPEAERTRIARPTFLRVTERKTRPAKPFRRQSAAQSIATLIFGDELGKRSRRTYWYDVQYWYTPPQEIHDGDRSSPISMWPLLARITA